MVSSAHIISGAAVGLAISSTIPVAPEVAVAVAFAAGVASHHILDAIPHTDAGSFSKRGSAMLPKDERFAWWDNIIATLFVLGVFFFIHPTLAMLAGAIGANFPDVLHHPRWWGKKTRPLIGGRYFAFHRDFHFTARGRLIPLGLFTTLTVIAVSAWYIFTA